MNLKESNQAVRDLAARAVIVSMRKAKILQTSAADLKALA